MTDPTALPTNIVDALNAYKAGETVKKCSALAGVSSKTFLKKVQGAGIPLRRQAVDPAALDNAISTYTSGRNVADCAAMCGIGRETFRQHLLRRGIPVRDRAAAHTRRIPTPEGLIDDYLGGMSVKAVSQKYGFDRNAVYRMLSEAGINGRDRSTAMTVRWQHATPEHRNAMLAAAHDAARKPQTVEHRVRIAAGREGRPFSADEVRLADLMRDRGHMAELGVPCGKYNLDLVIAGTVAVEIFGGNWHGHGRHRERFAERSRYVLDSGYSLAIIWVNKGSYPLSVACAQHLDTLTQITRSHPSIRGQHWVIRGDGYFLAVREDDGDEVPFILATGRRDD